jgi:hypothetical protein
MVGVSNGLVDQPTGATRRDFPFVMTMQDPIFKHPTAYSWSTSFQRELPFDVALDVTYVGRMGVHLQRERNINQLQPGTIQANPGVNPNALRPYTGFGSIRLSENTGRSIYHGLQLGLERRFRNGLGFGVAYTLSRLRDNADDKRDRMFNAYDPNMYWGYSENHRTHSSTSITSTSSRSGGTRTPWPRRSSAAGRSRASPTTSPAVPCRCGAATTTRASATPRPSRGTWSRTR